MLTGWQSSKRICVAEHFEDEQQMSLHSVGCCSIDWDRRSFTAEVAMILVQAFISCRLEYCNVLSAVWTVRQLDTKVPVVAERCCMPNYGARLHDQIRPMLRQLYWFPVQRQVSLSLLVWCVRHCVVKWLICWWVTFISRLQRPLPFTSFFFDGSVTLDRLGA